jgi:hypothetical protein
MWQYKLLCREVLSQKYRIGLVVELGSDSRAVKLPTFDGGKAKFEAWFMLMKAYSNMYGFEITLSKESTLPEREDNQLDESSREGKLGIMAKRRKAAAIWHVS